VNFDTEGGRGCVSPSSLSPSPRSLRRSAADFTGNGLNWGLIGALLFCLCVWATPVVAALLLT
jgi:hypothetical protein